MKRDARNTNRRLDIPCAATEQPFAHKDVDIRHIVWSARAIGIMDRT